MTPFFLPDWPAPAQVRSLVTTRHGGGSGGPYEGLNLGDHVGDDPDRVAANRAYLGHLACLPADPVWMKQVHGITCLDISAPTGYPDGIPAADAAVSFRPGRVCAVLTADCLPVMLCDQAGSVVGVAHAGWRGLLAGVLENTVQTMGCPAAQLMAWLGPAIGPAAFEVGGEVRDAFLAEDQASQAAFQPFRANLNDGKWSCDLYQLARLRLTRAGVGRIFGGGLCTFADAERFYSYRRDGATGRMASLIWLERL